VQGRRKLAASTKVRAAAHLIVRRETIVDAFWAEKLGQIVAGAIGGGTGYLLLDLGAKFLKLPDSTKEKVSRFGAIVCAIVAVKLLGAMSQPEITTQAVQEMDATINQAIIEAKPVDGKSATDVMVENMRKKANDELDKHPDGREKLDTAANQFLGFYLVNARTRQEYCLSLGVAIPTFVSEFDKINQRELISARKIQASSPLPDEEKFYQSVKASMLKTLTFQMKDQASQLKMTEKDFCQALESNPTEIAGRLRFSELMPSQSRVLIEAKL
jgi:hypothetical protein